MIHKNKELYLHFSLSYLLILLTHFLIFVFYKQKVWYGIMQRTIINETLSTYKGQALHY
jgi:hypothetical protein